MAEPSDALRARTGSRAAGARRLGARPAGAGARARSHPLTAWAVRHRWLILAAAAACLPVVVATISALASGWVPEGDDAIIAVRARDVAQGHLPLLGMPSTLPAYVPDADLGLVFHPGPALFYALAPFMAFWGSVSTGLLIGVAVLNCSSVVGIAAVAHRLGQPLLGCWALLLTAALQANIGPDALHRPLIWYTGMLPLLLFLFAAGAVVAGDRGVLPLAVLAGSLAAQVHTQFLPVTVVVGGFVVAMLGVDRRQRQRQGAEVPSPAPLRLAAGVGALCWFPVVLEQFVGPVHNIGATAGGFTGDDAPAAIGLDGLASLGAITWLPPLVNPTRLAWSPPSSSVPVLGVLVLLAAVGVLLALAARRQARLASRLLLTAGVAVLVTAFSAWRAPVNRSSVLTFAWPVATFAWWAIGWAAYRLFAPAASRWASGARLRPMMAGAVVLVAVAATLFPSTTLTESNRRAAEEAAEAGEFLAGWLGDGPYLVQPVGGLAFVSSGPSIINILEADGTAVYVPGTDTEAKFGSFRVPAGQPAATRLYVVTGERVAPVEGAEMVWSSPRFDELAEIREQLLQRFRDEPLEFDPEVVVEFISELRPEERELAATLFTPDGRPTEAADRLIAGVRQRPELVVDNPVLRDFISRRALLSPRLDSALVERYFNLRYRLLSVWLAPPQPA